MARCRHPVNRIVLMRKKNLVSPYFQNISNGVCMKSVGSAYDVNGPLAFLKPLTGWSNGVDCVSDGTVAVRFSGEVTWTSALHGGATITSGANTFTVSGPVFGGAKSEIAYDGSWSPSSPPQGETVTYTYSGGDYEDKNGDAVDDASIQLINCADPTSNVGIVESWTGEEGCGTVTLKHNLITLTHLGDTLVHARV